MCLLQAQVYADGVDRPAAWYIHHAVEQPALLGAAEGDVEILIVRYRELGEQGIAVMTLRIDRISPIGELRPQGIGKVFVLGRR